ncbi:acetylornithine deacetylase [Siccirubricoccus deserti]|uniref:Acetylornithine deacetylase n=1 Tax=Siccirubricoccus deserti TaxID=2013562 RepID=A0A9X0UFL6_9PROT|nr:acetylornithine deacetylase [Siccirubricoccus deserti]MBC4018013.1 acetylornithine deacetylase [Siccirubricoccus deserti]GGC62292.1 acetylornithine deacetylase [Siccirubricoccus deserti]
MAQIGEAFDEAVDLLDRLVGFDTTSRNSNLALIEAVRAWLAERGIDSRISLDAEGRKANLHAVVGPRVAGGAALSAHVDCVPVDGQAWLADPFVLRRQDGRLIGRGTTDMKGFAACAIAMMPRYARLDLARPVHLLLTYDEETTGNGARALAPMLGTQEPPPGFCIVGEPTGMAPVIAQKGYASWDAIVTGLSGHSSRAGETANALHAAAEGIAWLAAEARRFAREGRRAEGFDPPFTTVHAGTCNAGSILNTVPDRADFTFEVRSLPGDDVAAVLRAFLDHMERVALAPLLPGGPRCTLRIAPRSVLPGFDLAEDSPLTLLMQRLTGRNSAGRVSYGTEAGLYQSAGIATIVCGPGHIAQAHQPEEWIAVSEIEACLDVLHRLGGTLVA